MSLAIVPSTVTASILPFQFSTPTGVSGTPTTAVHIPLGAQGNDSNGSQDYRYTAPVACTITELMGFYTAGVTVGNAIFEIYKSNAATGATVTYANTAGGVINSAFSSPVSLAKGDTFDLRSAVAPTFNLIVPATKFELTVIATVP